MESKAVNYWRFGRVYKCMKNLPSNEAKFYPAPHGTLLFFDEKSGRFVLPRTNISIKKACLFELLAFAAFKSEV
ncbi:MAG: hypothetical protein LBB59_01495 [Campylobacteraceae bacterium]|jgi:hypothetical protein|nr:hypothetical protein [Campylobacteraceae bacterium]